MEEDIKTKITLYLDGDRDQAKYITNLCASSYYDYLFISIRELYPDQREKKIVLNNVSIINDEEENKICYIEENLEIIDQILFEAAENIDGELNLKFELYFFNKNKLKVYFFAENNLINRNYMDQYIIPFGNKLISSHNSDFLSDPIFILQENEISIEKEENDINIIITTGRFLNYVINKNMHNAYSILIFTSNAFLGKIKNEYLNNDLYPEVKCVSSDILDLLQSKYFL